MQSLVPMSTRNNKTPQLSREEFQNLKSKPTQASTQTDKLPKWASGKGQQPLAPSQRPTWASPSQQYDCFIGIDPGLHTGVAITDHRAGMPLQLHTLDFWATVDLLQDLFKQHQNRLLVVIENPGTHKRIIYARLDTESGAGKREKIAANVGANRREASLLIEWCRRTGIAVDATKPLGKLSAEEFEQITGIKHGSQHARDAARLILGR